MDKVVLNKEQLQQLKTFIGKRSPRFTEPSVQQEILDHFACKVEELMAQKPDTDFNDAMIKAHKSFGVKGFAPIADHIEQSIEKRYKSYAIKEMGSVLKSVLTIGVLATGILIYLLVQCSLKMIPAGISVYIFDMVLLVYVTAVTIYRYKRWQQYRAHKLLWAVAYRSSPMSLAFNNFLSYWFLMISFTNQNINTVFFSYYFPLFGMFTMFSLIVQTRLLSRAAAEAETIEQQKAAVA